LSKAKAKGTAAETGLVRFLREHGFPGAERRALTGEFDQGDVTGTPCLAWEVKNHKSYKFPEWIKEAKIEAKNAKADYGILVVKPNGIGITNAGDWWAILTVDQMVHLLREAGYGDRNDG
jgi:hypothetical protein